MRYHSEQLTLSETAVTDSRGTVTLDDLPDPRPRHPSRLGDASPLMERLWRIALRDNDAAVLVTADEKYVRYTSGEEELTQLRVDPRERVNAAAGGGRRDGAENRGARVGRGAARSRQSPRFIAAARTVGSVPGR